MADLLASCGFQVASIKPVKNPGFRFYLRQRGFGQNRLAKVVNFVLIGGALGLANLVGLHSKMVLYARKAEEPG